MNLRLSRSFGWAGSSDTLWGQSIRPMLDARELGASPAHIAKLVRGDDQLACRYRKTFGEAPSSSDDQAVMTGAAKALAAFQETFETPPTPFDRFRNALAADNPSLPSRRRAEDFIANCRVPQRAQLHERRIPRQRILEGGQA
jgi:cytochrome c peroxidase